MVTRPRFDPGAARILHDYQRVGYTWGPLLAACLLAVLAALALRRGARRLRLDAALLAAITLLALAVSQALSVFSYRYVMIASFGLPVAAALAVAALRSPRPRRPAQRHT
jgi:type II secretory pathway component PulF